jgi:hypothetical protein
LAGSSPAAAACKRVCRDFCTYEAGGRCYVWQPVCNQVCTLPNGKTITVTGGGTVTIERRALTNPKTAPPNRAPSFSTPKRGH